MASSLSEFGLHSFGSCAEDAEKPVARTNPRPNATFIADWLHYSRSLDLQPPPIMAHYPSGNPAAAVKIGATIRGRFRSISLNAQHLTRSGSPAWGRWETPPAIARLA